MRSKELLVVLVLVGFLSPGGHPAYAGEEVHCVNVHELTISPGISVEGTSGSFSQTSGAMDCEGPFDGRTPTGVGSYQDSGRYGTEDADTCQDGGEGEGVFSSSVPTTDGDLQLTGPYAFTFGDLTSNPGFVSGEFRGDGVRGIFKITPIEGDCVTSPITRVRVDAEFWFLPSFFAR